MAAAAAVDFRLLHLVLLPLLLPMIFLFILIDFYVAVVTEVVIIVSNNVDDFYVDLSCVKLENEVIFSVKLVMEKTHWNR